MTPFLAPFLARGTTAGIILNARVGQPAGFASGQFRFVQKINTHTVAIKPNGEVWGQPYQGSWELDGADPYPAANMSKFDGNNGWVTGPTWHLSNDSPDQSLENQYSTVLLNPSFVTYLMYCPPGNGSRWVALASEKWSFAIGAIKNGIRGHWTRRWGFGRASLLNS